MTDENPQPRWKREFPDFDGMDFDLPEGFKDESDREMGRPVFTNDDLGLELHVDHADASRRQFEGSKRFDLVTQGDDRCGSAEPDTVVYTDDFGEVLDAIDSFRSGMAP